MKLVVIGGVAAGLSAASRARRLDPSMEITVLERGQRIAYGACGLPYYLEGQVRSLDQLTLHTPQQFERHRRIHVRTGAEVAAIVHARREAVLAGGERIPYDRLVIATGARPAAAGIALRDRENVFTLHTGTDAERLAAFLRVRRPSSAVVVGAGYIGLETAGALRTHLKQVRILSRGQPLGRGGLAAETVRRLCELNGIGLETGVTVRDTALPGAELIVLCAGLEPNVALAREAGVETGGTGAIRVSDRMETNLGGVYAAGDCAETTHLVSGSPVWLPLGTTANKMGRVAGASAAGARERFPGICGTMIMRFCGVALAVTGLDGEAARQAGFEPVTVRVESLDKAAYFRGHKTTLELTGDRRNGRLLGAVVTGEDSATGGRINTVAAALTARMNVEDLEMLDLAYAPPYAPVWDPLLIAGRQLARAMRGGRD
ncbi:MAG: hypothetical protein FJW40_13845 [Acidobacteria bacterium]|nr:hypothetical protein [Acidobacteriota bacterium]